MINIDAKHGFLKSGYLNDSQGHDPWAAANERLARAIFAVLTRHYPGHPWGVAVNHKMGIAQVMLPTFTEWSYNIKLSELFSDPSMRLVVNGAGELLERYRMPRAGFDVGHYMAAQRKFQPIFTSRHRPPD